MSMSSAAWYWDSASDTAWVGISADSDACGAAAALASGGSTAELMFIQILEWSADAGTYSVTNPASTDTGDGSTDVYVMPYIEELGTAVPMDTGSLTVEFAAEGDYLDISGLSASNEFSDTVSGSFEACWCDALSSVDIGDAGGGPPSSGVSTGLLGGAVTAELEGIPDGLSAWWVPDVRVRATWMAVVAAP